MSSLLNNGKRLVGWGTALIIFGSFCMFFVFMDMGTFFALLGLCSLAFGVLLALSGSIIFCAAASPRKAVLIGGSAAAVGTIGLGLMAILFPDPNVHGPAMPVAIVVAACIPVSLLVCLVGLIRLALDRRARRVA